PFELFDVNSFFEVGSPPLPLSSSSLHENATNDTATNTLHNFIEFNVFIINLFYCYILSTKLYEVRFLKILIFNKILRFKCLKFLLKILKKQKATSVEVASL